MRVKMVMVVLAVAACGEAGQQTSAPPPDVVTESPAASPAAPMSIHDLLVDCAGAIAAEGNVDPLVEPSIGSGAENALWTVLALMDKEPGLFGVAGRQAAAQSKTVWQAKSGPERTARAAECTQRFGGG